MVFFYASEGGILLALAFHLPSAMAFFLKKLNLHTNHKRSYFLWLGS